MLRAAGLIVIQDNRILMTTRRTGRICIPGGKQEPADGKTLAGLRYTAYRETLEETGYITAVDPHNVFIRTIDDILFYCYRGNIVGGRLNRNLKTRPFWLDLGCARRGPNILQWPEWTQEALWHFKL